ncbi:MAG: radical SAM protein, partial [Cyclobacteriaceae bacterium]|nr:radical SAM protein [Cyclobacteriaceae bacterium]
MIGVSKLLLGAESESDGLRYLDVKDISNLSQISHHGSRVKGNKPIVVWNMTRQCNLNCLHCYAKATKNASNDEFTTEEAKALMDDVAKYNSPVFLFSGGEPFMRRDLIELIEYANSINLRPVISTNGTLITKEKAIQAKKAGVKYIGVSLDGMAETNDKFRGLDGAFEMAIKGIKNCLNAGI